jgi:hypothetical protein
MVSKHEWEILKSKGCFVCGRSEKSAGVLHKSHIKAKSRGGKTVFPLCPNCHAKYDRGDSKVLAKLGISPKTHKQLRPKKKSVKKKDFLW